MKMCFIKTDLFVSDDDLHTQVTNRKLSEFWLFGGRVTDLVGPVPHTSEYFCDGPLVVVGLERDVAVSVGGLPVHTCAKAGVLPGHMDIQEC